MAPEAITRTKFDQDEIGPEDITRIEIGPATIGTDAMSSNSTRSDLVSMLHADIELHNVHLLVTDISRRIIHTTDPFIRISHRSDYNVCIIVTNRFGDYNLQFGHTLPFHGDHHRMLYDRSDIDSMTDTKLMYVNGTITIDMMLQIHEISSNDDGNKQIDCCSADANKYHSDKSIPTVKI
jgi:hypothetical protein